MFLIFTLEPGCSWRVRNNISTWSYVAVDEVPVLIFNISFKLTVGHCHANAIQKQKWKTKNWTNFKSKTKLCLQCIQLEQLFLIFYFNSPVDKRGRWLFNKFSSMELFQLWSRKSNLQIWKKKKLLILWDSNWKLIFSCEALMVC